MNNFLFMFILPPVDKVISSISLLMCKAGYTLDSFKLTLGLSLPDLKSEISQVSDLWFEVSLPLMENRNNQWEQAYQVVPPTGCYNLLCEIVSLNSNFF